MLTATTDVSGDSTTCTDSTDPNDDEDDDDEESSSDEDETPTLKTTSTITESSSSSSSAAVPQTTIHTCCDDTAEAHHYSIRLPVPCPKNSDKLRTVDAHCAICLGEYQAGEKIVWSGLLQCQHAFHDECILPWLSKGKKRCPICRHWFVPGTKIDDQKAALQEATDNNNDGDSSTPQAGRQRALTASTYSAYDEEMEDIEIAVVVTAPPATATEPENVAPPETTTTTATTTTTIEDVGHDESNALEQQVDANIPQQDEGGEQPSDIENGLPPPPPGLSVISTL